MKKKEFSKKNFTIGLVHLGTGGGGCLNLEHDDPIDPASGVTSMVLMGNPSVMQRLDGLLLDGYNGRPT